MKMMKMALLAGAALAVTSAGAYADELDALKTSMENMGVIATPAADAPEGATITWSGYVRQALTFYGGDTHDTYTYTTTTADGHLVKGTGTLKKSGFDLNGGRARLTVNATTPTSVGDVDVHVQFGATQSQPRGGWDVSLVDYSGTWHITPELAFTGGRLFTGGTSQGETYGHNVGLSPTFATTTDNAMQLSYSSGPVSFVLGIENGDDGVGKGMFDDSPDFYANMAWSGDMMSLALQGNYNANAGATADSWQVGGTASANVSDAISLMAAAVVGHDDLSGRHNYWGASARIRANVTEATMLEASGGYVDTSFASMWNVNAGMYWTPATPLTIGLQGDYTSTNPDVGSTTDAYSASLVAWWRF